MQKINSDELTINVTQTARERGPLPVPKNLSATEIRSSKHAVP